jgi:hypothetical protein
MAARFLQEKVNVCDFSRKYKSNHFSIFSDSIRFYKITFNNCNGREDEEEI